MIKILFLDIGNLGGWVGGKLQIFFLIEPFPNPIHKEADHIDLAAPL